MPENTSKIDFDPDLSPSNEINHVYPVHTLHKNDRN